MQDVHIYVCEYDGMAEERALQEYAGTLPLELREGWRKPPLWEKTRQRILAWRLLETAVLKEYGYGLAQLAVRRGKQGKPYSSAHSELFFNISHCETACACIVGTREAGIDIERRFGYKENLAKKICHADEWRLFLSMEQKQRQEQLQLLWSMKESYVKMDGRGLGYGVERINLAGLLPVVLPEEGAALLRYGECCFVVESRKCCTLAACACEGETPEIRSMREAELTDVKMHSGADKTYNA